MKGWKKIFHINGDQKKAGVAIFISDKRDFEIKTVKRDKEGYYIMIKGSIQEDITIIDIYAPNIGALQYPRQMRTSMKEKNLQPRLLYPARILFKYVGEIKSFTDKQKLREFSTTKPALQQMLKDLL